VARGQALGNLFSRFTADRDSLYTAIQDCQQRIATLAARLEANGGRSGGAPAPAAPPVSPEALKCLQDVPALRRDLDTLRKSPALAVDVDGRLAALAAELDALRKQSSQAPDGAAAGLPAELERVCAEASAARARFDDEAPRIARALEVAQQALERASGLKGLEAAHQGLRAEVASLGRALDERLTAPRAADDTASRVEHAVEVAEEALRGTSRLATLEAELQGLAAEVTTLGRGLEERGAGMPSPGTAGVLAALEGEVQALREGLAAMRERAPGATPSLEPLRGDVEALSDAVRAQEAGAAEMRIEIARLAQVTQEALRHATKPQAFHPDAADRRELRQLEERISTRLAGSLAGLEDRLERSERDLVLMHARVVEIATVQASAQRRGVAPLVRALVETASTVVGAAVSALADLASALRGTLFAR
jgi:chromosome segregation ATPase